MHVDPSGRRSARALQQVGCVQLAQPKRVLFAERAMRFIGL